MADEIKAAELRGYSRGYSTGRRRVKADREAAQAKARAVAFWQRAFIAILPAALNAEGWKFGDKPINSTEDRVKLAARWADEARGRAISEGKL